jgi:predicted RNA-binding Zn ribbon-like protein
VLLAQADLSCHAALSRSIALRVVNIFRMTATIRAIGARPRCGPPAQAGRRIPAERDVADRLILLAAALAVPTLQLLAGFLRPRVDRRQCSAPGCSDAEKQVF